MDIIFSFIDNRYTGEALIRSPKDYGTPVGGTAMGRPLKVLDKINERYFAT